VDESGSGGEACGQIVEHWRLAKLSAEKSINGKGCYSKKRKTEMESAIRRINGINRK